MKVTIEFDASVEQATEIIALLKGEATPVKAEPPVERTAERVQRRRTAEAKKAAPEPEPEPEEEDLLSEEDDLLGDEAGTWTGKQAIEFGTEQVHAGKTADVRKALSAAGVKRVTELTDENAAAFMAAMGK